MDIPPTIQITGFTPINPEVITSSPILRNKHLKRTENMNNDHNNDSNNDISNSDSAWIKQDDGEGGNSFIKSPPSNSSAIIMTSPSSGQKSMRRRIRRKNNSPDDQAEALTEMSVRGLNLFRYASVQDGVYQCTECLKENVSKTFKNKYSFQRHAFLYHEGTQRKGNKKSYQILQVFNLINFYSSTVFPCPVCRKEFSRPDKMKNHMKMTHECYMPKECKFPIPLLMQAGSSQSAQISQPINNNNVVATSQ